MTSFSLPWYAIVAAQKGIGQGIPVLGCMLLAVVGPTAGRWLVDLSSGVTPKQFIRGEWFVSIAALTGLVWILDLLGQRQHLDRTRSRVRRRLHRARALRSGTRGRSRWQKSRPAFTSTRTDDRYSAARSVASRSASCATSACSSRTASNAPQVSAGARTWVASSSRSPSTGSPRRSPRRSRWS